MIFKEKSKKVKYNHSEDKEIENKIENKLQKINKVYIKLVFKNAKRLC